MTGMEEEPQRIQPKPTLNTNEDPAFSSNGSANRMSPQPPMQEMNQMEIQFSNPAHQAQIIAE